MPYRQEPELTHPNLSRLPSNASSVASVPSSPSVKQSASEKARAKSLRNAGKEAFLSVVRETVEDLAVEAATLALEEDLDMAEGLHKKRSSSSRPHRRNSSSIGSTVRPPHASHDSVSGSPLANAGRSASSRRFGVHDSVSGSPLGSSGRSGSGRLRGSDQTLDDSASEQRSERRRRSRHSGASAPGEQWEGGQHQQQSRYAESVGAYGGSKPRSSSREGSRDKPRSSSSRRSSEISEASRDAAAAAAAAERAINQEVPQFEAGSTAMEDDERETLLALLNDAYSQVNDLTDELKMSLDKLNETEKELKVLQRTRSNPQLLPKSHSKGNGNLQSQDADADANADASGNSTTQSKSDMFKGVWNADEGGKSTPAAVRQLQMEVQRLRQRNAQAHAKEEKYREDIAHMQRLMSVMESQVKKGEQDKEEGSVASASSSTRSLKEQPKGGYLTTAGGTRYQDGVTKPLVARVAELEEKLVVCSMENATAKQEHLTAELNAQKAEKKLQKLRHELAKSRAMNDLLQNEIDRLQGQAPEAEADGSGWRRWLGGLQEPLSEEPDPVEVCGEGGDSPVVVVRDLDNNQLVYAPGRSDFR